MLNIICRRKFWWLTRELGSSSGYEAENVSDPDPPEKDIKDPSGSGSATLPIRVLPSNKKGTVGNPGR